MYPTNGSRDSANFGQIVEQHQINMPTASHKQLPSNSNLPCADLLHEGRRNDYLEICLPLYKASMEGNWEAAKDILQPRLELVRFSISKNFETALHVAVSCNKTSFVSNLVSLMQKEDFKLRNSSSETALDIASKTGNVDMAKIMVAQNSDLLDIPSDQGLMPLHVAVLFKNHDMVSYLYHCGHQMNGDAWTNESRGVVLLACVEAEFFDMALKIVEDHEDQVFLSGGNVLRALAKKTRVFNTSHHRVSLLSRIRYAIASRRNIGWVKKRQEALQLLQLVWQKIMTLPWAEFDDIVRGPADPIQDGNTTSKMRYSSRVLFLATEMGNTRFVNELIQKYPELVREVNDLNQSIFHVAVQYRHRGIYKLLYDVGMGFAKDAMILREDENGNNMLHLAGILTDDAYNNRSQYRLGVVPQMRKEWLWFKVHTSLFFFDCHKIAPLPRLSNRKYYCYPLCTPHNHCHSNKQSPRIRG